jgi:hypothetical protein
MLCIYCIIILYRARSDRRRRRDEPCVLSSSCYCCFIASSYIHTYPRHGRSTDGIDYNIHARHQSAVIYRRGYYRVVVGFGLFWEFFFFFLLSFAIDKSSISPGRVKFDFFLRSRPPTHCCIKSIHNIHLMTRKMWFS